MQILCYDTERPTEFAEVDVFVAECRYNESDKVIRKMKGLKVCFFSTQPTVHTGVPIRLKMVFVTPYHILPPT